MFSWLYNFKSTINSSASQFNIPNKQPTITSLVLSSELLVEYDLRVVKIVLLKINSVSNKLCLLRYIDKLNNASKPTANRGL